MHRQSNTSQGKFLNTSMTKHVYIYGSTWNTYLTKRDDVDHFQLDDPYDTLTSDYEDNCDQDVAVHDLKSSDWEESPLSKVYIKNGTPMMDKLDALGKLVELSSYEET